MTKIGSDNSAIGAQCSFPLGRSRWEINTRRATQLLGSAKGYATDATGRCHDFGHEWDPVVNQEESIELPNNPGIGQKGSV